jgi:hypothetical protein
MFADYQTTISPNVSVLYFFHAQLDILRMKEAFGRVVSNNPDLAGRFRSKPFGQLSFAGAIGVPFHVVQLSDEHQARLESLSAQQVAAKPVQSLDLWGEAGFGFSKWGEVCKDNDDNANCTITVAQGSALAVVALSISHAIVDGKAYYDILRAWDSEFDAPGSTKPMTVRFAWTKKLVQPWHKDCCCVLAGMCKFVGPLFKRMGLMKKQEKIDLAAIYAATGEQYNAMKGSALQVSNSKKLTRAYSAQTQRFAEGDAVHISGNDAHLAFLGNALKSKVVTQMMSARGPNPKINGDPIPEDYLGNALVAVGANSRSGGNFDAMHFRKGVKLIESGNEGVSVCTHGCLSYHHFTFATSWAKIQHKPKFGTRAGCHLQLPHVGEWMVYGMNINLHVQTNNDSHLFIQNSLTQEQADSLKRACDDKGFTCTILSAAEVTNYWKSDPTRIHT